METENALPMSAAIAATAMTIQAAARDYGFSWAVKRIEAYLSSGEGGRLADVEAWLDDLLERVVALAGEHTLVQRPVLEAVGADDDELTRASNDAFEFSDPPSHRFPKAAETFMHFESLGECEGIANAIRHHRERRASRPAPEPSSAASRARARLKTYTVAVPMLLSSINAIVEDEEGREAIVDLGLLETLLGVANRDSEDLQSGSI